MFALISLSFKNKINKEKCQSFVALKCISDKYIIQHLALQDKTKSNSALQFLFVLLPL